MQQWPTAAGDISHAGHEQEWGVVGEDRVKEPKPLITGQNLWEQSLQEGPHIQLPQMHTGNVSKHEDRPPNWSYRTKACDTRCAVSFTCEVMPQPIRCCSSSLSWWARTFSTMHRIFKGGLGKYSNQCWHQFTVETENITAQQITDGPFFLLLSSSGTYESSQHFEAEQWVVLEELDKWKSYQRKVLHLSKDGCPVS